MTYTIKHTVNVGVSSINFKLNECGIYTLGEDGGIGKSYICGMLKSAQEVGADVLAVRCEVNCDVIKLLQRNYTIAPKIIFIDRYDNSISIKNNTMLGALSKSVPVLLDCKILQHRYAFNTIIRKVIIVQKSGDFYLESN